MIVRKGSKPPSVNAINDATAACVGLLISASERLNSVSR